MSVEFLDSLEGNVYAAIKTLEGERYYDYSSGLAELVRTCKHYQRIAESVLATHTGLPRELNESEVARSNNERDWYRFPEPPQRPCAEIEG
jgi:hypothetical protein